MVIPAEITSTLDDKSGDGDVAAALLTKAAMEIAHASADNESCLAVFVQGRELFTETASRQEKKWGKIGSFKRSKNANILAVQTKIVQLWRSDQSARGSYLALRTKDKTGSAFWAHRLSIANTFRADGNSKKYIETLLEDYDWIDKKRFGKDVSTHAWILVQHADHDAEFQQSVLTKMEPYLETGGIRPANYAFLWDRVAVNTGRKQRYGTQPTWECTDGKLTLQPMEDPENVNKRRAAMNMTTVEKGLKKMARGVCR
ncbi:MAG: DUF6624 domain-containing protein [Sphingorhabdus sp.]